MDLKVIGAGFGRTGTMSLKVALEMLGFSPCYHMLEVIKNPGHSEAWEAAAEGEEIDWEMLLAGFQSAVDWPACYFWRDLLKMNPGAKIILTERPEEDWYKSVTSTIFDFMSRDVDTTKLDPVRVAQRKMGRTIVFEKVLGNRFDKEHVLNAYRQNSAEVKREVPPEQLLVFDAPDGWEPLCKFLGVPVPSEPYPLTNTTEQFRARAAANTPQK